MPMGNQVMTIDGSLLFYILQNKSQWQCKHSNINSDKKFKQVLGPFDAKMGVSSATNCELQFFSYIQSLILIMEPRRDLDLH